MDYEDRVYDVVYETTIPMGQTLNSQAVQLRNVQAPFFLTGVTARIGAGVPAMTILDALGRSITVEPQVLETIGFGEQQGPMGSLSYLKWRENSTMLINLAELSGTADSPVEIVFRGFLRYRKGEAPCL